MLNKLGSFRLALVAGVGLSLVAASAYAQDPSPAPAASGVGQPTQNNVGATGAANSTAETERVIVTGSNIPTAEEVGPNPVDTYRAEDILKLGVSTTTDLQQKLPAATGGAINENIANGGDGRVEINLRGLGAKETLVLIDGRRIIPRLNGSSLGGQSVDINTIPLGLVDHIDILKDGASAIYGADAVAGVFNVFMKHKFRGLEVEAYYGNSNLGASNDQTTREGYLLAGTGDDKTDIVVFAQAYDRAAIYSRDRDISSNAFKRNFGGADLRSGNFAGRVQNRVFIPGSGTSAFGPNTPDPASFPRPQTDPQYQPRGTSADNQLFGVAKVPGQVDNRSNRYGFNFAALTPAIPAADRQYYYGSVVRDLCDKYLTVFADFRVSRTFFDAALAPAPFTPDPFFRSATGTPFSSSGISVPLQNAFNPFTLANATLGTAAGSFAGVPVTTGVFYRGLEFGPRTSKNTNYDDLFNIGFRGQLGEFGDFFKTWGYETSFRWDRNFNEDIFGGAISKPGLREALFDTNPATAFNPFGLNVQTQAAKDRVFVTLHHSSQNELYLEDFKLYGDLFNLPAGPISAALGVEHRKETYKDQPDSLNTTFNTIGSTDLQASRGTRDVWSAYGEIRIPITSPSWNFPGAYSLELDAAERYEYFSDFGDTETPKISLRYQPIDSSLTLRGTYSEAFHAPFLNELSTSGAETFPQVRDPANRAAGAFQVRSLVGGNANLAPEKAYEYTYGAIYTPKFVKGLTLAADFYHLDERNLVSPFGTQDIINMNFANPSQFASNVIRAAPTTQFPGGELVQINNQTFNLGRQITEGYDFEAIYQLDTSIFGHGNFGTVTATANATYLSRFEFANTPGGKETNIAGQYLTFGNLTHWRGYASLYYDLGSLDTGITAHYQGQYRDDQGFRIDTPSGNAKVREYLTFDALVSYTFNLAAPVEQPVAGMAKDGGKNVRSKDGKDKNVMPVSTAEYNPCGWRAWLNGTTVTLGMNNIFDTDPPFVASSFENGYDETSSSVQGRFYYVSLKKRF
ncbi:MAG: TonB-dependent receptor plug domain-containing protein [Verrucomicrobiota bacterium]|nr:TonB-dependent receptor plug domain-containing protein [Verrucomicrobiota bacterium]